MGFYHYGFLDFGDSLMVVTVRVAMGICWVEVVRLEKKVLRGSTVLEYERSWGESAEQSGLSIVS